MLTLTKEQVEVLVEEISEAAKVAAREASYRDCTVDLADLRDPIRAVFVKHGHAKLTGHCQRQMAYLDRRRAKGQCRTCGKPSDASGYCPSHHEAKKAYGRNYYRRKAGIPLDAPIMKRGGWPS